MSRDPKLTPHKNDIFKLHDGKLIEVRRKLFAGHLGRSCQEDRILFSEVGAQSCEFLDAPQFRELVKDAEVIKARGVK